MTSTRITGSRKTGKRNKLGSLFSDRETIRVYSGDSVSSSKAKRRSIRLATIKRIKDNVGKFRGKLANGARTDDRKPKLSGTLSSRLKDGRKLRIYASRKSGGKAKLLGIAKVKGKTWSFTPAKKLASNRRYIFKAQVTDAKGKKLGRPSKTRKLILDRKKPKLTITDNITGSARGKVTFTFTFSEKVKGFRKSDIRISGGTAGTFTKVNKRVYTLLVSPTENSRGNIVASVGKKKARDRAGNGNKAQSNTQAFDTRKVIELSDVAAGQGGFVIHGEAAMHSSGYSVSSAGDVNGDGLDDLIIGAHYVGMLAGRSYVIFGKTGSTAAVELSDITAGKGGFAIHGGAAMDYSGQSVSSAGDVNGDGLADLIIGANGARPHGKIGAGSSYVVYGREANYSGNSAVQLSEIAAGSGGFVIHGEAEYHQSGISVSSAGDVNGDGLADLIVGAYSAGFNGENSGSSYVVFGKKEIIGPIELSDIAAGQGGFVIHGAASGDGSGASVSSAGDVNGDGLADLVIGAFHSDPNGSSSGSTYVVFGKKGNNSPVQLSDIADGDGGFVVNGESSNNYSGSSVSSAGDVNGDGLSDLIIGAKGSNHSGKDSGSSYVVFGKKGNTSVELSDIADARGGGFAIHGAAEGDQSGWSVSSAGDVNRDGLSDLIIGTPFADFNGASSGSSYVVYGKKNDSTPVELSDIANGNGGYVIYGQAEDNRSGASVSSAGDVNGDGWYDLIVGAYGANSYAGSSYVLL